MDDCISREAAYKTLTEYYHHTTDGMHLALKEALSRVPSADVQEVKRGKWELVDETPYIRKHFHPVACSVCRAKGYKQWNYCPNCGAKMHD